MERENKHWVQKSKTSIQLPVTIIVNDVVLCHKNSALSQKVYYDVSHLLSLTDCPVLFQEVVLSPTSTSYNMNQLSASTVYTVRLQAISGPLRSRIISTVFTTSESTLVKWYKMIYLYRNAVYFSSASHVLLYRECIAKSYLKLRGI